jgi:ABC-type multidrug transport system permease subunit
MALAHRARRDALWANWIALWALVIAAISLIVAVVKH